MSDNFSLQVDGIDRVIQAFNELNTSTSSKILQKLQSSADTVLSSAQAGAPEDTSDMKNSGRVEPGVDNGGQYITFDVTFGDGSSTPTVYSYPPNEMIDSIQADGYTWFNELGTVKMPARPFLGPPFEEESQKLVTNVGDVLGG